MHSNATIVTCCWRCCAPLESLGVCPECRANNGAARTVAPSDSERRCWRCNKMLFCAFEFRGRIEVDCVRCKVRNTIIGSSDDRSISRTLNRLRQDAMSTGARRPNAVALMTSEQFIQMMEERWAALAGRRARERGAVASGLRFDVFARDGFRCRYCGVSVDDGAALHADHVIPRSKGGPTLIDNLVTACVDCNLGKSDKLLT